MKKFAIISGGLTLALLALACGSPSEANSGGFAGSSATPVATTSTAGVESSHAPYTSVGDGTFEVGVDMLPGVYKGKVPPDSYGCYYIITKTSSDSLTPDNFITNHAYNTGDQVAVTVKSGQWLTLDGCGQLKRQ